MEILAPCGNAQAFDAAINAGADAVYLGLKRFSARGNADNFDLREDGLNRLVNRAQKCGVKVYLALNTLVFDDEFELLREYIRAAADCGFNAVIIQDLGAAAAVREISPKMPLHASTQMTVTSVSGAIQLKELGFSRAVLARELSREEIRKIARESPIETEVFVHGAHCASVSGQCCMSSLFGGSIARSGNRGMCAQPCRLDARCGETDYALSLKDLSLIRYMGELREMGVTSAKIEGRMKRPEYVAAAVDACKTALAGGTPDMELLGNVFSRGGFTDGYYTGDYSDMRGIRSKEDVLATKKALGAVKNKFKSPRKRYTVNFQVRVKADEPSVCSAEISEISRISGVENATVTVKGAVPEKALTKPVTAEIITEQMAKLGGTVFTAGTVECQIQSGLTLKISLINELRRAAVDELSAVIQRRGRT